MEKENVDVVFVGKRTVMNYVMVALELINDGADKVVLKARGKLMSKVVDTVEVLRNRFVPDAKVESIIIGTEQLTNEGVTRNVSTLDITVSVSE